MQQIEAVWGILWRMIAYGTGLGIAGGAVCGPASLIILYAVDLFNGRYGVADFPLGPALTYMPVAFVLGALFGGISGGVLGLVSGSVLALGIAFGTGDIFEPKVYRNILVTIGVAAASALLLIFLGYLTLSPGCFFCGEGKLAPFLSMAVLPTVVAAASIWWAARRVLTWWTSPHFAESRLTDTRLK